MQRKTPVASFQHGAEGLLGFGAAETPLGSAAHALQRLLRNTVVDHVDHTAHRVAAIEKCRRSAHHFDTLDHQRINRHRVIVAQ